MQKRLIISGLAVALVLAGLWAFGLFDGLAGWAVQAQHQVQDALAGAVRRLRAGEAGALAALLAMCFAYGFLHAVGPGHGKALIGGYGVARRVRMLPLAGLALVSSLAQSLVAIGLVYGFVLILGWTRVQVEGMADRWLTPASQGAILLIGLWLIGRGWRHFVAAHRVDEHHHDHDHDHHHHHDHCSHAHGPSLEQVAEVTSAKVAALLVASIAIRPCSGALFLLIITWSFGIAFAGIAGVLAMGLGTASVTAGIAALSVWAREGALLSLPERMARSALRVIEIGVGAIVAMVAGLMLWRGY